LPAWSRWWRGTTIKFRRIAIIKHNSFFFHEVNHLALSLVFSSTSKATRSPSIPIGCYSREMKEECVDSRSPSSFAADDFFPLSAQTKTFGPHLLEILRILTAQTLRVECASARRFLIEAVLLKRPKTEVKTCKKRIRRFHREACTEFFPVSLSRLPKRSRALSAAWFRVTDVRYCCRC